jgi:hypothetical protein
MTKARWTGNFRAPLPLRFQPFLSTTVRIHRIKDINVTLDVAQGSNLDRSLERSMDMEIDVGSVLLESSRYLDEWWSFSWSEALSFSPCSFLCVLFVLFLSSKIPHCAHTNLLSWIPGFQHSKKFSLVSRSRFLLLFTLFFFLFFFTGVLFCY